MIFSQILLLFNFLFAQIIYKINAKLGGVQTAGILSFFLTPFVPNFLFFRRCSSPLPVSPYVTLHSPFFYIRCFSHNLRSLPFYIRFPFPSCRPAARGWKGAHACNGRRCAPPRHGIVFALHRRGYGSSSSLVLCACFVSFVY